MIVGYWWRTRILDQIPHDAAESMFIEPPKRKSWTREMDVITVPAPPASPASPVPEVPPAPEFEDTAAETTDPDAVPDGE